jgi:hypothetical protein
MPLPALPLLSQVEDAKKVLFLYGNKVSQVVKDVLVDLHKLKKVGGWAVTQQVGHCWPTPATPAAGT